MECHSGKYAKAGRDDRSSLLKAADFFTGVAGCDEDGRLLVLFFSAVEAFEFVHACTHVGEEQIEDRDCGHGFYDYDGTWDDDRVVTSFNDHFGVFSIFGDGGLWL